MSLAGKTLFPYQGLKQLIFCICTQVYQAPEKPYFPIRDWNIAILNYFQYLNPPEKPYFPIRDWNWTSRWIATPSSAGKTLFPYQGLKQSTGLRLFWYCLAGKTLFPYQGLKLQGLDALQARAYIYTRAGTCRRGYVRRKNPISLSGIETIRFDASFGVRISMGRKNPISLSGIETELMNLMGKRIHRRKNPISLSGIETARDST